MEHPIGEHNHLLKGTTEPLVFPGYKGGNGVVQNLSSYMENPVMKEGSILSTTLQFDIERHVSWDEHYLLLPFTYSTMIDVIYSPGIWMFGKRRSSVQKFDQTASSLKGFVLDTKITLEKNGLRTYKNPEQNVFINWSSLRKNVIIGIIQQDPVDSLSVVLEKIVPYCIDISNKLNPGRKISLGLVNQMVELALQSDKVLPVRRSF